MFLLTCSDLVLAGTQQSVELRLALDQEQDKSNKLVHSMKKLDEEINRCDQLLFQTIPKEVANGIRHGMSPRESSEVRLYRTLNSSFASYLKLS